MFIFACGAVYSGFYIITYKIDEFNTQKQIEVIENNTELVEIPSNNDNTLNKENNLNLLNADFSELKKINSDVRGWIKVNGTNINYPFVQSSNNSYYLNHSFDKSNNIAGWVFLDYRNNLFTDKNTIIYAHNTRNKNMFGSLKNILTNSWLNNSNNFIIKLSTEHENTLWQVFSLYHIPTTSDYIKVSFKNNEEFEEFANMLTNRSLHNFNNNVSKNDRILTLSTCYSKTERLVLHAKLIKREAK